MRENRFTLLCGPWERGCSFVRAATQGMTENMLLINHAHRLPVPSSAHVRSSLQPPLTYWPRIALLPGALPLHDD